MTKHRKTKRRQRGGGLFDWFSSSSTSSEPGMLDKTKNMFSGWFSSAPEPAPTNYEPALTNYEPAPEPAPESAPTNNDANANQYSMGGRRSRRRKMRGGKGDLGLTYYATPVSGIKVVEPTKGGSRRRRRTRRHKKY
jgi:hypothetical protein